MDTGYPALITEPLATPDPGIQKPGAAVKPGEGQGNPNPESTGPPVTTAPAG